MNSANGEGVQLEAAENSIHQSTKDASKHSEKLLLEAQVFQQEQFDIEQRRHATTGSESTIIAARQIKASTDKLHKLEVSKGYIELIQLIHQLRYIQLLGYTNHGGLHRIVKKLGVKLIVTRKRHSCRIISCSEYRKT